MEEKWIPWKPLSNLSTKYFIENVISDKVFEINLSDINDKNNKISITYTGIFCAHRCTEKVFSNITYSKSYPESFYQSWTFFKVENSAYLSWLSSESCGISDDLDLMHFCIVGSNLIVDIVTNFHEPIIRKYT